MGWVRLYWLARVTWLCELAGLLGLRYLLGWSWLLEWALPCRLVGSLGFVRLLVSVRSLGLTRSSGPVVT